VAHGLSNALYEEASYDSEGQNLASSFLDYPLPSAREMPRIEMFHLTTPSPINPLGVKGAGEAGTLPVPAAVAGAVEDALRPFGVRVNRMPLNPARISDLIHGRVTRMRHPSDLGSAWPNISARHHSELQGPQACSAISRVIGSPPSIGVISPVKHPALPRSPAPRPTLLQERRVRPGPDRPGHAGHVRAGCREDDTARAPGARSADPTSGSCSRRASST
jgi:hypothetical protein